MLCPAADYANGHVRGCLENGCDYGCVLTSVATGARRPKTQVRKIVFGSDVFMILFPMVARRGEQVRRI
jgi:hypothetical protein